MYIKKRKKEAVSRVACLGGGVDERLVLCSFSMSVFCVFVFVFVFVFVSVSFCLSETCFGGSKVRVGKKREREEKDREETENGRNFPEL
jgi:hypothetical protein